MLWSIVGAVVILCLVAGYVLWRKWIAPWGAIEQLVRQVSRGERPRTFLVEGSLHARRVAIALEETWLRQSGLDRQIAEHASGQQAIFSAMEDALLVVDAERRVALFNSTFQKWFGLPDGSLGAPLLEVVRDSEIKQTIEATLARNAAIEHEITAGERALQVNAVPLAGANGRSAGAVVLFHDITKLKRVDDMRRDFVANVSHELRTPLSILRGYIETLLESQTSRDELRRILGVMERHSNRLGLLLEDLLTLAKLESTNPNLELSTVKLDELCLNVTRDWEKKFRDKDLSAIVDFAPGLPTIEADASRLQEVLYNLLDNAVKYSPPGGAIRLHIQQRGDDIVLSVSDNGPGISREDLPRIFERFYRADKSHSGGEGTGLGLAIVKHIAQLHRGRVEAESEPAKGTTIRVILPTANPARAVTQT